MNTDPKATPECSPSRAPDSAAFAHDPIRLDDDGHVASLGEWCDCQRCVSEREWERNNAAAKVPRVRDPAEVVDIATARARVLPTPHVDQGQPTFLGDFRGQVPQRRMPAGFWWVFWTLCALFAGLLTWAVRS